MIQSLANSVLRRMGYALTRIEPSPSTAPANALEACLRHLKAVGFQPQLIYDIGANRGAWTRQVRAIYPDASILMVEPQAELRSHVADLLDSRSVHLIHRAVSDRTGKAAFLASEWDVTSHLVKEGEGGDAGKRIEVEVTTVDLLVAGDGGKIPDFIKIDAEGFDLKVLDGAASTFGQTEVFLVEAGLCNPEMENDVTTVVNRMKESGYRLVAIIDINPWQSPPNSYAPGLQWLVDLLFVRSGGKLLKALQAPAPGIPLSKW